MYVMFVMFLFIIPSQDKVVPVTRPEVGYYSSEQACKDDTRRQVANLTKDMPRDPDLIATHCVRLAGPEGVDS